MSPARRIKRNPRGGFELRLPDEERDLLSQLASQLVELLDGISENDAHTPEPFRRLFPAAYPSDASAEAAYVRLARADLLEHHRNALETMENSAHATHLDEQSLELWLSAINDLRLVLGSTIEVTEDEPLVTADDPNFDEWICYRYLTFLQSEIIDALADLLPPVHPDAGEIELVDPWGEPPGDLRWDGTELPGSS